MNKRVMGVGAHPDDLEWYAGATICKLAHAGADIIFVILTEGEKGTYDADTDPHTLAARRKEEQRAAAQFLGIRQVIWLGYRDGELEPTPEAKKKLAALYREHQPELLLAFDPWKRYELHPDHLAAGKIALDARLGARMPLFYPDLRAQGLNAWTIPELWLFDADAPNHFEDVSATFDAKLSALALHQSQDVWGEKNRAFLEDQARAAGKNIGERYAEAFRRIVIEGPLIRAE
jgi:LmbE family N-acetylglucosaminyl deacetylase